jgi:cytochrome c553
MKKMRSTLVAVSLYLFATTVSWAQLSGDGGAITAAERKALIPSRSMIDDGREIARLSCADCHGMNGISEEADKPHLAGQRAVYLYRVMRAYQQGKRGGDTIEHKNFLNDEALLSVAAYYANLTPAPAIVEPASVEPAASSESDDPESRPESAEDDPFLGIRPAMKKCIKCHDEDGRSTGSGMPSLTAQDPEYFIRSMQAYVDGSRSHKLMKRLVSKLDESTIAEMAIYYGVQEPLITETQGEGDVDNGKALTEDCAICHGDDGNASSSDMPTLAGQDAKYFLKAMKAYQSGKRQHEDMVEVVEDFSEDDFKDMASFYAAQQPIQKDVRTPLNSKQWLKRCTRCHGIDGNSTDPRFPMLAGQNQNYLNKSLRAYALGVRSNTLMRAMSRPLRTVDIEYIAAHFASRQPKAVVYMPLPCEGE